MDIVEIMSVMAGSVVLLGLFISIAYAGVIAKSRSKQAKVSALNHKWQKLIVPA